MEYLLFLCQNKKCTGKPYEQPCYLQRINMHLQKLCSGWSPNPRTHNEWKGKIPSCKDASCYWEEMINKIKFTWYFNMFRERHISPFIRTITTITDAVVHPPWEQPVRIRPRQLKSAVKSTTGNTTKYIDILLAPWIKALSVHIYLKWTLKMNTLNLDMLKFQVHRLHRGNRSSHHWLEKRGFFPVEKKIKY